MHYSTFIFDAFIQFFGFPVIFSFGFLHLCQCKTIPLQADIITLTSGVACHYIVLHPVSSKASQTFELRVLFIPHSWFVDYRNIWLDFSQRRYFGSFKDMHLLLYIDLDTFILLPGWIILMKLGARWQKSQVLRPCFDVVNYSLSSVCRLLISSSLVWNTANWIFDGSNRWSVLDLVKKMERAKERHWREPCDESILKKFPKPSR